MNLEVTRYEFKTESDAQEAWQELDRIGRQRNKQNTISFREGKVVYLRPEFISQRLMYELGRLAQAF